MGKVTGFIEWVRQDMGERPVHARLKDWADFKEPLKKQEVKQQAGRCMDCGIPFCQQGCPLGNLIPDWNDAIYHEDWKRAFLALQATNPLPEFTGRLCPAPCEGACVLGINDDPVSIEQLELTTSEYAFEAGWVEPRLPLKESGNTVAIIGSGPAGLAAATILRESGHSVTVFERDAQLGGLLRYGIPDFKLEKWIIDRRVEILQKSGIQFQTNVEVGSDALTWSQLMQNYDAVVLCTGAPVARDINIPGRDLDGIHYAMEYLTAQNRVNSKEAILPTHLSAEGKRVIVIGGGDTGSDCLGTALRQGAREVIQLELMPPPPKTRADDNPWPNWPKVYRISSSHAEGGERRFSFSTQKFEGESGQLTALVGKILDPSGDEGQNSSVGQEHVIQCDMVLLAMGFTGPDFTLLHQELQIPLDEKGHLIVDQNGRCPSAPIYVAGDAKRGASLIVWALSDGVEIARAVDQDLRGRSSILSRGSDAPFNK